MPPMLVPSVPADPGRAPDYSATPVAPVVNAGPQQIGQLGEAMSRAGSQAMQTGQTMGDQIQNTVDDANVRSAETGFLQQAQTITDNYTHQLGKNAMDAYPAATAALAKAKQDAAGALTNPIQQRMFNYVSTNHLMMFGRQMGDHNFQQTVNYGVEEHTNSAAAQMNLAGTNYSDWQNPGGTFAGYKKAGTSEALQAASLAGHPPNSATAQAAVQKQTSALGDAVLTQMTGKEQYDEAQTYYETAIKNNELDDQMVKKWGAAITEGHNAEKGKNLGDQAVQVGMGRSPNQQQIAPLPGGSVTAVPAKENPAALPGVGGVAGPGEAAPAGSKVTDVMGSPREGHEHHGIDYGVPVGTNVVAPKDGTVSRVWDDGKTGGGLSMAVSYPDGSTQYFMHLSAQNYQQGQKVTQGAILGLSGQTGNATGPTLHWAQKDPDGNWVDPRGGLQAPTSTPAAVATTPGDPLQFTDPARLKTGLEWVRSQPGYTPRQLAIAEAQVERQYSIATGLQQQTYENAKKAAVNLYYQQNGSIAGLDPAIKSQLTGEDLYKLSQPIPRKDDEDTVLKLLGDPSLVLPGSIEKYRMDLSQETYQRFFAEAQKNATKPDKIISANLDNNQLDTLLAKNNLSNLVAPTMAKNPVDAQRKIDLKTSIDDQVNLDQQRLGRELSRQEKEKIMTDTIGDTAFLTHSWFGADKGVPRVALTPEENKKAYVNVGNQRVKLASIPAQDQLQIADAWRQTEKEHGWAHRELSGQEIATKWLQLKQSQKAPAAAATGSSWLPPM